MANQKQLQQFRRGVQEWNAWRRQHSEEKIDLSDANLSDNTLIRTGRGDAYLSGVDLSKADLSKADLSKANLSKANLNDANLSGANLNNAYLGGAYLSDANLSGVDLGKADLSHADLIRANFSGANLHGANLHGANLSDAILGDVEISNAVFTRTFFANNDFRLVKGLVAAKHYGPSHIDLYSVQLPQDGSALYFLRSVGVPEEWIDFYRAQMIHPIQYYSVFISYSSKDEQLARRLHADLQDQGVRCWFAPEDLKIGDKFRQRIDEAIHLQDKLLLLLSEHSIKSPWVENEVEAALEKEDREQREMLFPIRLDDEVMQTSRAWAATLRRTRHISDFTHWMDPQAYQHAFERLLRDLNDTQS